MQTSFAVFIAALTALALTPGLRAAEPATVTIDPGKVVNQIDEKVYGHFLEHIFFSCNGGLWGELVWDRSFEGNIGSTGWRIKDGCVVQNAVAPNLRLTFGDTKWKDYEYTLEARKTGGNEGFLIPFRYKNDDDYYWVNLGGLNNNRFYLERGDKVDRRRHGVGKGVEGAIDAGKWYPIRVRCEGPQIQVWVDGKQVLDVRDDDKAHLTGKVGVGLWNTKGQFRNMKVTSLDGKVLFEGLPEIPARTTTVPAWDAYGPGKTDLSNENPFNGDVCQAITSDGGETGIQQMPLCIRKGEVYKGSLWVRGEAPEGLVMRLLDGDKKVAEQAVPAPAAEWKEFPIELKPDADAPAATLQVGVKGKAKVCIDQVSLMPESWRAAGGFRPDLLKAIADLRPPIIRWPGGSFSASYRWKDAVGPQAKRRPYPKMAWDDKDVNSYGTDEFIAMCRRIGCEPLIVINIGMHEPLEKRAEYCQEAADWVEYCNGPATSKWGKVRAENGHPEPYNVKYWEIDNEVWKLQPDDYVSLIKQFVPAMKKVDPSLVIIACGSGQLGKNWGAGDTAVITQAAEFVDYLSVHHYESPARYADGPAAAEKFWRSLGDAIAASKNPKMKLHVSEWNAQSTDWRTGLYAGGALNVFERCGNIVGMAAPALFLRHASAKSWDNAFINFDQRTWFPAPNYVVMKLWRDHYAPQLVASDGTPETLNGVATKSADGRTLYYKVVNPTDQPADLKLVVADSFKVGKAAMEVVAPGSLEARNTLDNPDAVKPAPGKADVSGQAVTFSLPPLSAAVITIEQR